MCELRTFELSDPIRPARTGRAAVVPGGSFRLAASGGLVHVLGGTHANFQIVDVHANEPVERGLALTMGQGATIAADRRFVATVGIDNLWVQVFDVRQSDAPVELGYMQLPQNLGWPAVDIIDRFVYVTTDKHNTLQIVEF